MKQIRAFRNRAMRKNRKGGIEGLPLQLMIVIIIASMGLAMMVGWMGNIDSPQGIGEIEVKVNSSENITVTVYDYEGNPVEGADVILTGMGVCASEDSNRSSAARAISNFSWGFNGNNHDRNSNDNNNSNSNDNNNSNSNNINKTETDHKVPHGTTDSDGKAVISFKTHTNNSYGYLNIEVCKAGYNGNSTQVLVTL